MPTIYRQDGYRFFFYSNESGEPAHVHVSRAGAYGKWWLKPLRNAHSEGFTPAQNRAIRRILHQKQEFFLEQWQAYFGRQ